LTLDIFKEKNLISDKIESNFGFILHSIGSFIMINIERGKYSLGFSQPILDKLADFFNKNNFEETFDRLLATDFVSINHWFDESEDEGAHFIDTSHFDRFYLLMAALLYKKGKRLNEIKIIEKFNATHLKIFERETRKLKEKNTIWDQLLEGNSQKYFEDIINRLKECTAERDINLRENIRNAKLSEKRVNEVKSDIIKYAKRNFIARNFINLEQITEDDGNFSLFGKNIFNKKIFFVDEKVDSTTYYAYIDIGRFIGKQIGVGESEYLIKQIFNKINIKENQVQFDSFSFQNLNQIKRILEERGFTATTILTSFSLQNKLRQIDNFSHVEMQSDEMPRLYGKINEIEIYINRIFPKGIAIILDKNHIGTLKILNDLDPLITTDFDKNKIIDSQLKEGKILEEQKEETLEKLEELVNIKALEEIRFEFGDQNAGLVFYIKDIEPIFK